jgi:hypothetical protein
MSILRTTLAAALFASLSAPTLAAENDPVVVSGSDDPVIVSGVEARVAQPIFALRPDKWTRQLGPAGATIRRRPPDRVRRSSPARPPSNAPWSPARG